MKLAIDSQRYQRLRKLLVVVIIVIAAIPSVGWVLARPSTLVEQPTHARAGSVLRITAPGRIEPKDGVIHVAPAVSEFGAAVVKSVDVQPGQWVKQGEVLATLLQHDELRAGVVSAERRAAIAQAKLKALAAGGKEDDLRSLRAEIESDEAALAYVQAETERAQQLRAERLLSVSAVEAQQSRLTAAARALDAKRAKLSSLSSVRPADVVIAEAELDAALAEVEERRARSENSVIRAPADGRVLDVHAFPGQRIGEQGLLSFGRTDAMYVDAEVMESDIARAKIGDSVRITGDVLQAPATGTVEHIGYLVGTREVFNTDPTAFADSRVVHVKIRAHQSEALERFINARVTVTFDR
jgi:HlyD family secretion protein